jgi:DME family drug/metabolite transporter
MGSNHREKHAVWYVAIAVLMWSTGGLFIKLTALDAYQVTFFRSFLAGVTVLAYVAARSRAAAKPFRNELRINTVAIFASIIYATLLFLFVWATKHTTAANAIFLQYTAPIYILILGPFMIGEKFHLSDLVTVIFCIAGMSLFFVGKLEIADYQGNAAALGSGIFLGLYIMLLRHPKAVGSRQSAVGSEPILPASLAEVSETPHSRLGTPDSLNPVVTVIYGNFLLALVTLPSGIAALPTITLKDTAAVAFLGVLQIGVAYILFIKGVTGGTRPLDASIIGFIEPLLNPVWVYLFVGEEPSKWAILGGTIIIATVVAHTLKQYRPRAAA